MAPFDGKYITSYLIAKVIFAPSLTIYEICANKIKFQKFDIKNEEKTELASFDWKC